uniref:Srr-9 n=1 Tax=Pristionchus pacificus TaxID=54126 RepID=A0A2A6C9X2_PRIPA|eukprot:PDM74821.1 srr-9 [Pristionchus pacificus]
MSSSSPFLPEMEDSLPKHEIGMDESSSSSISSDQDDIPPQRLTRSRRALIGPFSILLTLTGFDLQKSLCGNRTYQCRSITCTIIFIIILILFLIRALFVMSSNAPSLSWEWSDSNIIGFTAFQSFVALILLARWTATGLYSAIYTEILKVKKYYTDAVPTSIHEKGLFILGLILGVVYILITLASSIKSSIYGRYSVEYNGTVVMLHPGYFVFSLDNLFGVEILLGIWMSLCTVIATASYVYIHIAVRMELTKFNEDLSEAIEKKTLLDSLSSFNIRHIAILRLVVLLTDRLSSFASFSTFTIVIANVNAFYQMSSIGSSNAFGTVSTEYSMDDHNVHSTSSYSQSTRDNSTIGQSNISITKVNSFLQLQQAISLILNYNELIYHPDKIALSQLMVTRNRVTPTRMAIMNAIVVNTHTPHIITLLVPAVVAVLSYAKRFQQ